MNSIERVLSVSQKNAGRLFLIDSQANEELTYAEFFKQSLAVASDLYKRGYRRGDRIAMLLYNCGEAARFYFGCLYAGLVAVPVNPILSEKDINGILRRSRPRAVVVSAKTAALLPAQARRELELSVLAIDAEGAAQANAEFWDLRKLPFDSAFMPFSGSTPEDPMCLVFTSGTTASPGGALHRIADLIDNAVVMNEFIGIGRENRFYNILPVTYLGGYHNLLIIPFIAEGSVVLERSFSAQSALDFWKPAIRHEVNTLWLVPTILSILLKLDRAKDGAEFCSRSVKLVLCGTSPLSVALRSAFEKRYGVTINENYGLSETMFLAANSPRFPSAPGYVGRTLPGIEISIREGGEASLPPENEGEVFVRTPYLMKGSMRSGGDEIQELDPRGWYGTGDIGLFSRDGELRLTGRKKDIIIKGGINVSAFSIEEEVYTHPGVYECAVVSAPHPIYGEDIAIAVVAKEGVTFSALREELRQLCKKRLGEIQQPCLIVEMQEFPRSSSGKIQKNRIRDHVRDIMEKM